MNNGSISVSCKFREYKHSRAIESGAVLIVGLIFLVALALLGITAMQTSVLQERMAGNLKDWNIALAAAEAALRDAEKEVLANDRISGATGFSDGCSNANRASNAALYQGLCLPSTSIPVWKNVNWSDDASPVQYVTYGAKTGAPALLGVATQPRYVVEAISNLRDSSLLIPNASKYLYRITARGYGADIATQVTVQSVYKLP
jgi:type IV pilus assembly protein PilX